MSTVQGQSTSNAASMSQKAAIAALNGDQSCVATMNRAFKERHDYIVAALNTLPGVSCRPASGAFYAFADVSKAMANLKLKDDNAFAEHLINKVGVAVVPGQVWAPGICAYRMPAVGRLWKAVERMRKALTVNGFRRCCP
jgi:aspartate aminotransferase